MIDDALLARVIDQVGAIPEEHQEDLSMRLRRMFPEIHFSVCRDDDVPTRVLPVAGDARCQLYLVASGAGCVALTDDADKATGLLVALCDGS